MKCRLVVAGCVGLALMLASPQGSLLAAGPAIQVPATVYVFGNPALQGPPCGSQVLDMSTGGNKLLLKLLNHALAVSEDPRLTGDATVEVEVSINNVNGHVNAHGVLVIEPWGYAGTWEAPSTSPLQGASSSTWTGS